MSIIAACARVVSPCGASVSPVPVMTPPPTAHYIAGMAYSLTDETSV